MQILKKTIQPNVDLVVSTGVGVSFSLVISGHDPLRPKDKATVHLATDQASVILQLTTGGWEPVPSQAPSTSE